MTTTKLLSLLTFSVLLLAAPAASLAEDVSEDGVWAAIPAVPTKASEAVDAYPRRDYAVDESRLREILEAAPMEFTGGDVVVMTLPMPDGTYERVRIEESPILSPSLQAEYPELHTYRAQGLDDPTATGRFDRTPAGFHGMMISERGTVFVDPADDGDSSRYISYWDHSSAGRTFECGTQEQADTSVSALAFPANNPSGDQLREYRLAMSATGEYTQFLGGTAAAAAQIATTINRVTGVLEREVAIRLNIVATRIFTDPATDPFTNLDPGAMLGQNQTELDNNVGDANYDMGHVFGRRPTGFSGVATLGVVCTTGSKGRGVSTSSVVTGDGFDVRLVAHEMGHQLAADHTWNGNAGSCSFPGQWQSDSAYEPASGSTIMSYAGICTGQNVQGQQDDYYHTHSFDQITTYRDGGGACGTLTATGNNPPTVDAGPDCTIPRGTPFTLTASGDDTDGDPLTYTWEQFDLNGPRGNPQATNVQGPLFRSREGTSDPSRTFPRFTDILSGAPTPYELLPSVDRTLNFRVTARDNRANGGGVDYDALTVTVSGAPFEITDPSSGADLECGDSESINWNVGGGAIVPSVAILFSSDGGTTFSTVVGSTNNDGSETITAPTTLTTAGRIKLEPSAECFFAVSDEFDVVDTTDPSLTAPPDVLAECLSPAGTPVALGTPVSSDLCDASLDITNDAPASFPLGDTTVTWSAVDDSGNDASDTQTVTIEDTIPPVISCNSPPTIVPPDAPISFTATADDVCDAAPNVQITGYDCFKFTKKGKRIDKTESCVVTISGNIITILDSGGVDDHITWTVVATDASGNESTETCEVLVVNPGKGP